MNSEQVICIFKYNTNKDNETKYIFHENDSNIFFTFTQENNVLNVNQSLED